MTQMQVDRLKAGASMISRKPDGHPCKIMVVDRGRKQAKIYDTQTDSVFWCNFDTLVKNWQVYGKRKALK